MRLAYQNMLILEGRHSDEVNPGARWIYQFIIELDSQSTLRACQGVALTSEFSPILRAR